MNSPRAQDSQDWLHIALVLGSEASAQPASSVTRAQAADSAMDAMLKEFAQPGCSLSRRSSSYFSLGLMAAGMPLCDAAVPVAGALPRPARVVTSSLEMVDVPELSPASEAPEDGFFRDEPAAFESAASPRPATKRAKPMAAAEGVKVLQCELCFKTYHTAEGLRLHVRSKHENDRSCVCAQCGRGFVVRSLVGARSRLTGLRAAEQRPAAPRAAHPRDFAASPVRPLVRALGFFFWRAKLTILGAAPSRLRASQSCGGAFCGRVDEARGADARLFRRVGRHQQMHMLRTPLGYSA